MGDAELATTGAPLMKHTYREHPDVTAMSEEQLSSFLKERQIAVEASPGAVPLLVSSSCETRAYVP